MYPTSSIRRSALTGLFGVVFSCSLLAATSATAAVEMDHTEFRSFCGYFLGLDFPVNKRCKGAKCKKIKQLRGEKAQMKAIAKLLGVKRSALKAAVEKGKKYGANCEEVGKIAAADAENALKAKFKNRIDVFVLDTSDPEFVVASVTWKGLDRKKLEEEASLIASIVAEQASIAKTIVVRAIKPGAKDKAARSSTWFEGKINPGRAARIHRDKIKLDADRRYMALFDDVIKIAPLKNKLMKYDSRKRKWVDAPPPPAKKEG